MAVAASDLKCSRRNTKMDCRKSPTRQQTNAPKFIKRKTCCIYTLSSLKSQSDPSRWHFCNSFQSSLRLNAFEISNTLTSSKTAHSLSPPQRPLCIVGRLEKRKTKARGEQWEGEKKKRGFPLFPSSPARFPFFESCHFYWDTQREPLWRREVHSLLQKL